MSWSCLCVFSPIRSVLSSCLSACSPSHVSLSLALLPALVPLFMFLVCLHFLIYSLGFRCHSHSLFYDPHIIFMFIPLFLVMYLWLPLLPVLSLCFCALHISCFTLTVTCSMFTMLRCTSPILSVDYVQPCPPAHSP